MRFVLCSEAVLNFLDDPNVKSLMVYAEGKELKAVNKPPAKYKSKAVYFVKHAATKLDKDNMVQQVGVSLCGMPSTIHAGRGAGDDA